MSPTPSDQIHRTCPRSITFHLPRMKMLLLHKSRVASPSNIGQGSFHILYLLIHFHYGLGSSNKLSIPRTITKDISTSAFQTQCQSWTTHPTRARSFSLLLAMSRRSSCSTRRTVGIGYWKASCHDFRLWGSGASGAMLTTVLQEAQGRVGTKSPTPRWDA